MQAQIHRLLEPGDAPSRASRIVGLAIGSLILLNVAAVCLETVESFSSRHSTALRWVELISVGVFTVEYLLRLWSCTCDPRFGGAVRGRVRFALTPMALVDLLAILPFYLPRLLTIDLRFVRVLRLLRMIRLLKLGRHSRSVRLLGHVLRAKLPELIVAMIGVLFLLVLASSMMYHLEHETQPEEFSSIPHAMWWGIVTLTTVGYGDSAPVTGLGKVLGGFIAMLGIGVFALPAGIFAAGYAEAIQKQRDERLCPHCGATLE